MFKFFFQISKVKFPIIFQTLTFFLIFNFFSYFQIFFQISKFQKFFQILNVFQFFGWQVMVQRTLASKNMTQAKAGCIFASYMKIIPLWTMIFPGMAARVLFPITVGCASAESCKEAPRLGDAQTGQEKGGRV